MSEFKPILSLCVDKLEVQKDHEEAKKIICYVFYNRQPVSIVEVPNSISPITIPINNTNGSIQFVFRKPEEEDIYGCISFTIEDLTNVNSNNHSQWATLFEDPEDDIFDGEMGVDDEDWPRVLVSFNVSQQNGVSEAKEHVKDDNELKIESTKEEKVKEDEQSVKEPIIENVIENEHVREPEDVKIENNENTQEVMNDVKGGALIDEKINKEDEVEIQQEEKSPEIAQRNEEELEQSPVLMLCSSNEEQNENKPEENIEEVKVSQEVVKDDTEEELVLKEHPFLEEAKAVEEIDTQNTVENKEQEQPIEEDTEDNTIKNEADVDSIPAAWNKVKDEDKEEIIEGEGMSVKIPINLSEPEIKIEYVDTNGQYEEADEPSVERPKETIEDPERYESIRDEGLDEYIVMEETPVSSGSSSRDEVESGVQNFNKDFEAEILLLNDRLQQATDLANSAKELRKALINEGHHGDSFEEKLSRELEDNKNKQASLEKENAELLQKVKQLDQIIQSLTEKNSLLKISEEAVTTRISELTIEYEKIRFANESLAGLLNEAYHQIEALRNSSDEKKTSNTENKDSKDEENHLLHEAEEKCHKLTQELETTKFKVTEQYAFFEIERSKFQEQLEDITREKELYKDLLKNGSSDAAELIWKEECELERQEKELVIGEAEQLRVELNSVKSKMQLDSDVIQNLQREIMTLRQENEALKHNDKSKGPAQVDTLSVPNEERRISSFQMSPNDKIDDSELCLHKSMRSKTLTPMVYRDQNRSFEDERLSQTDSMPQFQPADQKMLIDSLMSQIEDFKQQTRILEFERQDLKSELWRTNENYIKLTNKYIELTDILASLQVNNRGKSFYDMSNLSAMRSQRSSLNTSQENIDESYEIEVLLLEFLLANKMSPNKFVKLEKGLYMYMGKKIAIKILQGKLHVAVEKGFIPLQEYVQANTPSERSKTPVKLVSNQRKRLESELEEIPSGFQPKPQLIDADSRFTTGLEKLKNDMLSPEGQVILREMNRTDSKYDKGKSAVRSVTSESTENLLDLRISRVDSNQRKKSSAAKSSEKKSSIKLYNINNKSMKELNPVLGQHKNNKRY